MSHSYLFLIIDIPLMGYRHSMFLAELSHGLLAICFYSKTLARVISEQVLWIDDWKWRNGTLAGIANVIEKTNRCTTIHRAWCEDTCESKTRNKMIWQVISCMTLTSTKLAYHGISSKSIISNWKPVHYPLVMNITSNGNKHQVVTHTPDTEKCTKQNCHYSVLPMILYQF